MMNKLAGIAGGLVLASSTLICDAAQQYNNDAGYAETGDLGDNTLDERVARLEKRLSNEALMDVIKRSDQLQREVQRLNGEVEQLTHELSAVKKQQTDMFLSLEQRLQPEAVPQAPAEQGASAIGAAPASVPVTAPPVSAAKPVVPPVAPPPVVPVKAVSPSDEAGREAAYQKALGLLKEGKYPDSIREFKKFQTVYPSGEYVDNAVYWTGEAYYVLRDLPSSKEAFRKLTKDFPQSTRVPDAMLKLAYIEYDSGLWSNAKNALHDVIKRYPGSKVAEFAEKRLTKIKQEGH